MTTEAESPSSSTRLSAVDKMMSRDSARWRDDGMDSPLRWLLLPVIPELYQCQPRDHGEETPQDADPRPDV